MNLDSYLYKYYNKNQFNYDIKFSQVVNYNNKAISIPLLYDFKFRECFSRTFVAKVLLTKVQILRTTKKLVKCFQTFK